MERSGYDSRRKRPFVELPSEHRNTANFRPNANHFQPLNTNSIINSSSSSNNNNNNNNNSSSSTTSKIDYRGYTTPVQEYRPSRIPANTSYIGGAHARYTPYDVPNSSSYMKTTTSTVDDHRSSTNIRPRYPLRESVSEPLDKRIAPKVSWQYDLPTNDNANQICEKYERPMDPKEFKEQCRKAYLQNAEDRKRNAELSVWGKCDWAIYEKCHDGTARYRR